MQRLLFENMAGESTESTVYNGDNLFEGLVYPYCLRLPSMVLLHMMLYLVQSHVVNSSNFLNAILYVELHSFYSSEFLYHMLIDAIDKSLSWSS